MAILTIPDQQTRLTEPGEIRTFLESHGIVFQQWEASAPFTPHSTQEEILGAYQQALEPYMAQHGYQTADVISVNSTTPGLEQIREKFLREHTHSEDEVRFFVEGQGHFWFHLENPESVFCVTCEAGDLLSVPAGVKHWFDLGDNPDVKVIRIFTDVAGWVPHYTGSGIDAQYLPAAGAVQ